MTHANNIVSAPEEACSDEEVNSDSLSADSESERTDTYNTPQEVTECTREVEAQGTAHGSVEVFNH